MGVCEVPGEGGIGGEAEGVLHAVLPTRRRGRRGRGGAGVWAKGMARDFLSDIAGNAKLQRLYCELRDALDNSPQ